MIRSDGGEKSTSVPSPSRLHHHEPAQTRRQPNSQCQDAVLESLRQRPLSRSTPGLAGNLVIGSFMQSPYFSENQRLILRQVLWIW